MPIKDFPLRAPGQSIREHAEKVFDEKILIYIIASAFFFAMAALEWQDYFSASPPNPWLFTILFFIVLIYSTFQIRRTLKQIKSMHVGSVGEEAVGQFLEEKLRPQGYQILHDIIGKDFNVDHVVIGATGIYTIETKTARKPAKGVCKIKYDGRELIINDEFTTRAPIKQAEAQSHWLAELIEKSTGKQFFVKPVVVYPGWYVENQIANSKVWVFNEKSLIKFITGSKHASIPPEDISLVTYHLKRYVLANDR